jgi:ATP-dependent exoDNAse (exonuclease V) beta subunit
MTDAADLRTVDAEARRRALDVEGSFIVQAPAGSGKTELLAQRVLALLASVAQPESILAITFTRKAAAEMRERIVGALRAVADPAQERRLLREDTRELARAALVADARHGWGLLANPGRLRIQTIDSLNHMLARRLPLLSGLGAEVAVEDRAQHAHRLAAERLLLHLEDGEPAHAAAVRRVLVHLDNRVHAFVELVGEMLARREAWLPVLPSGALDDAARTARLRIGLEAVRARPAQLTLAGLKEALPDSWLARAVACAARAAAALNGKYADSPIAACAAGRVPGADPADLPVWQGLAQLLLIKDGTLRSRFDVTVGLGGNGAGRAVTDEVQSLQGELAGQPHAVALLHATRELPEARYAEVEWELLLALFALLRLAAAELDVVFAERGRIDHPRAALAARAALGSEDEPTDTALALDAQLAHVLVDEFQDTSESQVQLLRRLTAGWEPDDGRTLFLVGDPMQSIYRFRHAEVGLFLEVRDHGLGPLRPEALTLAVNFRSTQPIVAWVNRSFATVLGAHDDELRGQVAYAASTPAPAAGDAGGVQVHLAVGRGAAQEAREIADVVERRLAETAQCTEGGPGRVAILVRGRAHLQAIVPELRARGIAWRASDIDPLATRPAVRDLRALTAALEHRGDRTAWLATLRAPWCGLVLADLHALCGEERERTLIDLLRDHTVCSRLGPEARERLERTLPVLEAALLERPRLGLALTVERAWHALGGPATLDSAEQLAEARAYLDLLVDLEQRGRGRIDEDSIEDELAHFYSPAGGSLQARVEIMTIHRAKGLQFDTVIVPGLERGIPSDAPTMLRWTKLPDVDGESLLVAPVKAIGGQPGALYRWLGTLERERSEHERRRLLYVAATRAERCLHWFGSLPPGKATPRAGTALAQLWPVLEPESGELAAAIVAPSDGEVDDAQLAPEPWLRRLPAQWRVPPPPAGPPLAPVTPPPTRIGETLVFDWASETARHVGTVVHRELQLLSRLAEQGATWPAQRASEAPRFASELAELGVPGERRAAAVARVLDALRRTLADERGRWLLGTHSGGSASELALTGRLNGEIVSVVIDRSFIDAAGVRWIVDYKTSSHEGGGLDDFLDAEQDRYRTQLERYARLMQAVGPQPIRLGLYFPLLSAWREWPTGRDEPD